SWTFVRSAAAGADRGEDGLDASTRTDLIHRLKGSPGKLFELQSATQGHSSSHKAGPRLDHARGSATTADAPRPEGSHLESAARSASASGAGARRPRRAPRG